ncbi:MAG TPA: signal peptidase I [Streptosporangiaceae bacterium]|nr:signal peptidase I [Streptosporangiaceae bacterium]
MSTSSFDSGDPLAVMADSHPDLPAPRSDPGAGRHARSPGAHRSTAVRTPQELDYRLRGLGAGPTEQVAAPPTRTDDAASPSAQAGLGQRGRRYGPFLFKLTVFLAVAAVVAWLFQAFLVQPFSVPGDAMAPTIQAGDRILVAKSGLIESPIHSGEIVVFRPPRSLACAVAGGLGGDLVLRVVALPGQTIWSVGKTIYVDGRPWHERGWYSPKSGQIGSTPIPSTTLGRNQYFVMGDNRSDACDSRVFGPIAKSSIVGVGIAVVMRHGHVFLRTL